MLEKFKKLGNFFKKDNFVKTKLLISAILSLAIAIVFEYKFYHRIEPFISKNRIVLLLQLFSIL